MASKVIAPCSIICPRCGRIWRLEPGDIMPASHVCFRCRIGRRR